MSVSYSREVEVPVKEKSAVVQINLSFGYSNFHEGWSLHFGQREEDVTAVISWTSLKYDLSLEEMRQHIAEWLQARNLEKAICTSLLEQTMWYVEYLIELREGRFGRRHYEELLQKGQCNWLGKMPSQGMKREGVVVEAFTKGTWSFRGFLVKVDKKSYLWHGARYDEDQNLWWGVLDEEIIYWQASPPPPLESLIDTLFEG